MGVTDDCEFKADLLFNKMARIHTIATDLEKATDDKKKQNLLRAATENLDDLFTEFSEVIAKLSTIYNKQTPPVDKDLQQKFADYETLFYNVKAIVMTCLPQTASTPPRLSLNSSSGGGGDGHNSSGMALPKMKLPEFDGNILEWQSFQDVFLNSVHTTDLSDIRKFTYLKSALKGEALAVISSLPTTATNYKIAWDSLVSRYHDTNRLTNAYLEALFDMPSVTRDAKSLRKFSSVIEQHLGALKALDHPTDSWSIPLMFLFKRKLAASLREKWESHAITLVLPASVKDFVRFLDNEVHVLESSKPVNNPLPEKSPKANKSKGTSSFVTSAGDGNSCPCGKPHSPDACSKLLNMSASARLRFVKSRHLCISCFGKHYLRDCTAKLNCDLCNSPHHALLCFKKYKANSENKPTNSHKSENSNSAPSGGNVSQNNSVQSYHTSTSSSSANRSNISTVMLATARAVAIGRSGIEHIVKVLIDSASQASFITAATVERLKLNYDNYRTPIFGFGQSKAGVSRGLVQVEIRPRQSHLKFAVQALVVEQIAQCPRLSTGTISWPHIRGVTLADPQFYLDQEIDILLGAEWYARIVSGAPILGPEGAPDLLDTVFGYCLLGRVACEEDPLVHVMCTTCDFQLDRLIRAFWETEEAPKRKIWSKEEQECEEFFLKTVKRQDDGRFVVRLPFRQIDSDLGDSYALTRKRFHYLENRLDKNPVLRERYNEFMADYLSQGHMVVAQNPPEGNAYYIPHHCIYRQDETFSRFRVVFDCSMKTTNGLSLNSVMHIGRKMQKNICDVLFRFRLHRFCMVADIRQMYRNINVAESDQDYQRIFWRFSPADPLLEYKLVTILYGNAAAPYLALRSVAKLVEEDGGDYPLAARIIVENTFVDDMCMSVPTVEQALELQQELIALLGKGKFELRKWLSNRAEILEKIPEDHRAMSKDVFSFQDPEGVVHPGTAILGLAWNPVTDIFSYRIQPSKTEKTTKKIIFSEIARLYDPLGFLSPVTMYGKWIMQHLWAEGLEWDDTPSDAIVSKWVEYRKEIPLLSQFSIPRCSNLDSAVNVQLHGFSDASERGFAALVYLRVVDQNHQVSISLLMAKSKVSPLKRESLPRLELCGAVLMADLLDYARQILEGHCSIDSITAWCDSMVTLQWVKASPHKWKTYVANRTSHIQDRISPSNFRHVPGAINPSDIASRGALPQQFLNDPLWVNGPDWLREDQSHWPKIPEILEGFDEVNTESRIVTLPTLVSNLSDDWISNFSSYPILRRFTAYWMRFIRFLRDPENNEFSISGPTTDELRLATVRLAFIAQQRAFEAEIKHLKTEKPVPSKLRKLNPYIDSYSAIRVGGRLDKSKTISEDRRHPLLLPKDHHLTKLIIDHVHKAYFHAGPLQVQSLIQAEFWIVNAREVIRNQLSKCVPCFRAKPKEQEHLMGELPAARLEPISAFNRCAVDYAGPVMITMGRIRNAKVFKAYICIFVCFSTKAMHLELVSDLTTDAFIAALRRFVARRGTVREIHSDSGTNFVGAKRKLAQWYEVTGTKRYNSMVARELAEKGIAWKLNAPGSPHMNGLVEAGVKSVKKHLIRVVGEQKFTFEEFYTILTQIEAVVNSRPITPVSSDPNDLQALTPGHFLMQQPAYVLPDTQSQDPDLSHRWKTLQHLLGSFWKRWHKEYLGTLQLRAKWTKRSNNLKVGDLVLLKEPNLPPTRWRLARVVNVFPGTDGTVRVAEVRTSQGVFTRTVRKLCPLPINN